ncbi:coniferyl aldehyde dehydrogenase [Motiliproteus coralliicola]|uniref:Aldehyde dehydrogenase n=1 Tax=Motiliproteus coralliicola TaxID=2283196 RepID=A0A369WUC1_9GAMM|nr:coniferyl aldehyde dehydrogenase [Motiliproteus coralliicola]RDE24659.1 coniferyl aldehyde dehydrogenase [Motiliproteus coralliicola]
MKTNHQGGASLGALLERQKAAFKADSYPSLKERQWRLKTLKSALVKNRDALLAALDQDFGGRSHNDSMLLDLMPTLEAISYNRRQLKKWMKSSKRQVPLTFQPASAQVVYQPLGVVGIVTPWNFPIQLSCGPLITALTAGNRAMIKMSEFTPATSELLKQIIAEAFPEDLVTVVTGGADVAAQFSQLPFDHLLFTGSTTVGKHVMAAAAKNLTPVTLELGGKSPVIVDKGFPIAEAAERICFGKSANAGQICVAPDYVLVHKTMLTQFVEAYLAAFRKMYPDAGKNREYTAIVSEAQHRRLMDHIEDARQKGAIVWTPFDITSTEGSRRMIPHLVLNVSEEMSVMHEEIFGPILPIIPVDDVDEAIDFVTQRPRPLALYYFGNNRATQEKVMTQTHSGGACINEVLLHVGVDDIPFGGIGPSGMGHYHGHEGFLTLSKAKSVLSKGRLNSMKMLLPPYNSWFKQRMLRFLSGG